MAGKGFIKAPHALMEGKAGFHLQVLFGISHNTKNGILDLWMELDSG